MAVERVLVVGMGQMGRGIAQVCAEAGLSVYVTDADPQVVEQGIETVDMFLSRKVEKGKLSAAEKEKFMNNIHRVADFGEAREVDLAIEAVTEKMEVKQKVHAELDRALAPKAILSSCTSALPITEMSAAVTPERRAKFIGLHFHNPVPVMKLVEIVRGYDTDEDTYRAAYEFVRRLQKTPVTVKDTPGFITNRVGMPMVVEAIRALEEGVATAEDIDTAFREGMGYPLGPLELCDFVGLDTMLHIMEQLYESYGDPRFFPPPLIRKKVSLGHLGRKTGKGFYEYPAEKRG